MNAVFVIVLVMTFLVTARWARHKDQRETVMREKRYRITTAQERAEQRITARRQHAEELLRRLSRWS